MIQLPPDLENPWLFILFTFLLIVQVVLFVRYIFWHLISRSWVMVPARIVNINCISGSISNEEPDKVKIEYAYSVKGKEYISNKITISDYACSWLVHPSVPTFRRIASMKENSKITVFYSTKNPKISAINIDLDLRVIILSLISICFLVVLVLDSAGVIKLIN